MGLDPRWRVYRVRQRFTGDGRTYEKGELIELATLLSWRNGARMAEQGIFLTPHSSEDAVTAQRQAAGRKSREKGQDFKKLVWRAANRVALPNGKNVRERLLSDDVKRLRQHPSPLSIDSVRAREDGGLDYVTTDGRAGTVTGKSWSSYLSQIKKDPPEK